MNEFAAGFSKGPHSEDAKPRQTMKRVKLECSPDPASLMWHFEAKDSKYGFLNYCHVWFSFLTRKAHCHHPDRLESLVMWYQETRVL